MPTALLLAALAAACGSKPTERAGLAFTRYASAEQSSVWVADADGSHERRIAERAYSPKLSPDGRRLAYLVRGDAADALPTLVVRELSDGAPRTVSRAFDYEWSPDGTRLAAAGDRALVLFDVGSGTLRELASGRPIAGFSFAPDGRAVAYGRWNGGAGRDYRSDVFVVRLADGRATRLTHDRHSDRPIWGRGWMVYRRFSIDGDWTFGHLRVMRPDGGGDRLLVRGVEKASLAQLGLQPLELSRDGKRLLACAANEFFCPPLTVTVPGGRKDDVVRVGIVRRGEILQGADLASDGREVLVTVGPFDDPVGGRVYALPFAGGEPRLLVSDASEAVWAR